MVLLSIKIYWCIRLYPAFIDRLGLSRKIDENLKSRPPWVFTDSLFPKYRVSVIFEGASGALFIFDLVDPSSFEKLNDWYDLLVKSGFNQSIIKEIVSKRALKFRKGALDFIDILITR